MPVTTLDERAALVLIDLQRGIVAAPAVPHSADDVVARAAALADVFRAQDAPVVLVRVTAAPDGARARVPRDPGDRRDVRPGRGLAPAQRRRARRPGLGSADGLGAAGGL
ncbi:isochorismatase family protein [Cellulomonas hominis]